MREEWVGPEPQLHLVWAGKGEVKAVILTGLTHAATARAERLATLTGAAVLAVDLVSLATLPLAQAIHRVSAFLDSAGTAIPLLVGDDLAAAFAAEVVDGMAHRPVEATLIGAPRVKTWKLARASLPPLAPVLDGSHLVRLWHFLRDLHVDADDGEAIPSPANLNAAFLEAAEHPVAFAELWKTLLDAPVPDWRAVEAIDDVEPPRGKGVRFPPAPEAPVRHGLVATPRGAMYTRCSNGEGRPVLFLHHGPGATPVISDIVASFARPTIAPDFIGCGRSEQIDATVDIATLADDVIALLDELRVDTVDIFGTHTGAFVALEIALRVPHRVGRIILEGFTPPVTVDPDAIMNAYPQLRSVPSGAHLVEAWNLRRDMFRFAPFHESNRAAQRRVTPAGADFLHRWVMTLLRGAPTFRHVMRAAFAYDGAAALKRLTCPAMICAGPEDSLHAGLAASQALEVDRVLVRETPATVWHPGQSAEAVAATIGAYRDFLDA